jgi:LemA protein
MLIFMGLILLVAAVAVLLYNRFVRQKNVVREAWSGIDVQLRRRYDLIPNLVNAVKGYSQHERSLFEKVTQARARAIEARGPASQGRAENQLTGALKSLFAVAENYPELKANQNFLDLQKNLSDIENDIQMARRFYNGAVREYNISVDSFPSMVIARMFNFSKEEFFEIELATEREAPEVNF